MAKKQTATMEYTGDPLRANRRYTDPQSEMGIEYARQEMARRRGEQVDETIVPVDPIAELDEGADLVLYMSYDLEEGAWDTLHYMEHVQPAPAEEEKATKEEKAEEPEAPAADERPYRWRWFKRRLADLRYRKYKRKKEDGTFIGTNDRNKNTAAARQEAEEKKRQQAERQLKKDRQWKEGDDFVANITRWWKLTFGGYSTLWRLRYDDTYHVYVWNETYVKRSELLRPDTGYINKASRERSVHVTGRSNTRFLFDEPLRRPRNESEGGFSAISAYNYMRDNSINEAIAATAKDNKKSDMTAIYIIGVIIAGVVAYMLFFR